MIMYLEKKNSLLLLGLITWAFLAFFSFWQAKKIFTFSCYFLSVWPFCDISGGGPAVRMVILVVVFLLLILFGYLSFRNWQQEKTIGKWWYIAILFSLALFTLPFASNDIQFYFSIGKAVSHNVNPYTEAWNIENIFFYPASVSSVIGVMYGPLALDIFSLFYQISGNNILIFILLWKVFMVIALIVCGLLVFRLIDSTGDKKLFYFFWLTQPLFLFEWVGNGHFDGLWLLFVLLAFIFARKNQWVLVVISLIIGIWIKFIPLLFVPWFLLWWWQGLNKNNWKKQISQIGLAILLGGLITYFFWKPFWRGWQIFEPIILQSKWAVSSLFSVVYYSLKPLFDHILADRSHWFLTRFLHLSLFILVVYLLYPYIKKVVLIIAKKIKMTDAFYIQAIFITMLVYLLVWQKSFWPWYLTWIIPLGLVVYMFNKNIFLRKILLWISLVPLLFYLPWMLLGGDTTSLFFYWYVVILIAVYPIFQLWHWRKTGYDEIPENYTEDRTNYL